MRGAAAAKKPVDKREREAPDDAPAPLQFDRRCSTRWQAIGPLEAVRTDGFASPTTFRINLVNESAGGLAANTNVPLAPGTQLRVRTSPNIDAWRNGVVVRCMPSGSGYRIALAYQVRRAA